MALLLACLGLATRLATATAFGVGCYLIGFMRNVSLSHTDAALIIVLGIMAVARCGDACALDNRLFGRNRASTSALSGVYRWPMQLIRVVTILPLFAGGLANGSPGSRKTITGTERLPFGPVSRPRKRLTFCRSTIK